MMRADLFALVEIGDGAGNAQHAGVAAHGEFEFFGSLFKEFFAFVVWGDESMKFFAGEFGVDA